MRAFGYWYGQKHGGSVINNVRWGTEETFSYCFDGIEKNSIVAIGSVASKLRDPENQQLFEVGFLKMLEVLEPQKIIFYGTANCPGVDKARKEKGSTAQIIEIINPSKERNIKQVQVSPDGSRRHGKVPYVKISTSDEGKIKIIDGTAENYKTAGDEKAKLIFRRTD